MAIDSLATPTTAPKMNKTHRRGKLAMTTRIVYNAVIGLPVALTVQIAGAAVALPVVAIAHKVSSSVHAENAAESTKDAMHYLCGMLFLDALYIANFQAPFSDDIGL
jgi:hypothetical protein